MKRTIFAMILVISQIAMARGDRIGNGLGELLELATNTRADAAQLTLLEKLIIAFEQSEGNIPDFSKIPYGYSRVATWIMVPQTKNLADLVDLGEKSFYISSHLFNVSSLTGNVPFTPPIYQLSRTGDSGLGFNYLSALARTPTGLTGRFGSGDPYYSKIELRQYGSFFLMAILPGPEGKCYGHRNEGQNNFNGYCGIVYSQMPD